MAGEEGYRTALGEGGVVPISKLRTNMRRRLGPEWSMSRVGTPPPHNLYKTHGLVVINNKNNIYSEIFKTTTQSYVLNVTFKFLLPRLFV